jgi:hypothetical protein
MSIRPPVLHADRVALRGGLRYGDVHAVAVQEQHAMGLPVLGHLDVERMGPVQRLVEVGSALVGVPQRVGGVVRQLLRVARGLAKAVRRPNVAGDAQHELQELVLKHELFKSKSNSSMMSQSIYGDQHSRGKAIVEKPSTYHLSKNEDDFRGWEIVVQARDEDLHVIVRIVVILRLNGGLRLRRAASVYAIGTGQNAFRDLPPRLPIRRDLNVGARCSLLNYFHV